jgi:hypothetical protein
MLNLDNEVVPWLFETSERDPKELPHMDPLKRYKNNSALLLALDDQDIIAMNPNTRSFQQRKVEGMIFNAATPLGWVSISDITDPKQLTDDLITIMLDYAFTQENFIGTSLLAILSKIIRSYKSLDANEREVIGQFVGQAKKRGQSQYDAALHYEDLQKGFVDTLVPFDKTLNSLLNKGIITKQDEDIYRLIR